MNEARALQAGQMRISILYTLHVSGVVAYIQNLTKYWTHQEKRRAACDLQSYVYECARVCVYLCMYFRVRVSIYLRVNIISRPAPMARRIC